MKEFSLFLRRWLPVVIWAGAVIYASTGAGSGNHTAGLLRSLLAWLHSDLASTNLTDLNFAIRKTAHVLQFVVYSLLVWRAMALPPALEHSWRRIAAWTLGSALALALASEGIQLFSPLRTALLTDVLLDFSGAVVGAGIVLGVRAWAGRGGEKILLAAGWGMESEPLKHRACLEAIAQALRVSRAGTLIVNGGLGTPDRAGDAMRQLREASGAQTRIIVCLGWADPPLEDPGSASVSRQEILERFWLPAFQGHGISCLDFGNVPLGRLVVCGGGVTPAAARQDSGAEPAVADKPMAAFESRLEQALPGPVLLVSPPVPFEHLQPATPASSIDASSRPPCDPRIGRLLVTHAPSILLSVSTGAARQSFAKPVFGIPCLVLGTCGESPAAVAFCPKSRTVAFL